MSTAPLPQPACGFFPSRDGLQLYQERWPARSALRATLLFVHGYGDHCVRYRSTAEALAQRGFDCRLFDYRGHGQAAGPRGHCVRFDEYLDDFEAALSLPHEGPLYVLAHSHGALIALRYFLGDRSAPVTPAGLILSSPLLRLKLSVPAPKRALAQVASRLLPRLRLPSSIPPAHLSHEPAVVAAYETDRWVHKVARARWYTEMLAAQRVCMERAADLELPTLVLQAGDDRIVDGEETVRLFERLVHPRKRLIVYPGFFHEVLFEAGRDQVMADLDAWISNGPDEAAAASPTA